MRWPALILPIVLVFAFLLGWTFPNLPEEPLGVARGGGGAAGLVLRPGESTGAAVRFLRTLQRDPPPPPGPPPVIVMAPPPPPPPPDVSVTFRTALSGIARDPASGVYSALIRDAAGGPQITVMSEGDVFGDGWRIRQITADAVTLARADESRVVRLYG